jgi:hypothetical protein
MPIAYGLIELTRKDKGKDATQNEKTLTQKGEFTCNICNSKIDALQDGLHHLKCYHHQCTFVAHVVCFGTELCHASDHDVIPINGHCTLCHKVLAWDELVKNVSWNSPAIEPTKASKDGNYHWTDGLHVK